MAQAKIAIRGKKSAEDALPPEERWVAISTEDGARPGRSIYLESEKGIGKAEAEEQARRLHNARAVPRMALDRFDCYSPELHQRWQEEHGTAE